MLSVGATHVVSLGRQKRKAKASARAYPLQATTLRYEGTPTGCANLTARKPDVGRLIYPNLVLHRPHYLGARHYGY